MIGMVFEILKELQQGEGRTIVLVEQNARKGLEFADIGYVLSAGRVRDGGGRSRAGAQPRRRAPLPGRVTGPGVCRRSGHVARLELLMSASEPSLAEATTGSMRHSTRR